MPFVFDFLTFRLHKAVWDCHHGPTHRLAARMAALATLERSPHTQDRIRNMVNIEGAELLHRLTPLTQCSLPDMVGDLHDIPAGRSRLGLQRRLAAQLRLTLAASLWEELDDTHPLSHAWPFHRSNDHKGGKATHPGQSSWILLPPSYGCKVPNATYRDGIKRHLALPLHDIGARCNAHNQMAATAAICGTRQTCMRYIAEGVF